MDIIELYSLLDSIQDFDTDSKEKFTKRIHRKFITHKICSDHELTLMIYDDENDIFNKSEIVCDFQGWSTIFSTKIVFKYENEKLVGLKILEDEHDIERAFKMYPLEEIRNPLF
jgi:hypothetical protein